jgi:hypothetical protein
LGSGPPLDRLMPASAELRSGHGLLLRAHMALTAYIISISVLGSAGIGRLTVRPTAVRAPYPPPLPSAGFRPHLRATSRIGISKALVHADAHIVDLACVRPMRW